MSVRIKTLKSMSPVKLMYPNAPVYDPRPAVSKRSMIVMAAILGQPVTEPLGKHA